MTHTVSEKDLKRCLLKIRNMRLWAAKHKVNPWAFRQALLIAVTIDTQAAYTQSIPPENLERFDKQVALDMEPWINKNRPITGKPSERRTR